MHMISKIASQVFSVDVIWNRTRSSNNYQQRSYDFIWLQSEMPLGCRSLKFIPGAKPFKVRAIDIGHRNKGTERTNDDFVGSIPSKSQKKELIFRRREIFQKWKRENSQRDNFQFLISELMKRDLKRSKKKKKKIGIGFNQSLSPPKFIKNKREFPYTISPINSKSILAKFSPFVLPKNEFKEMEKFWAQIGQNWFFNIKINKLKIEKVEMF